MSHERLVRWFVVSEAAHTSQHKVTMSDATGLTGLCGIVMLQHIMRFQTTELSTVCVRLSPVSTQCAQSGSMKKQFGVEEPDRSPDLDPVRQLWDRASLSDFLIKRTAQ